MDKKTYGEAQTQQKQHEDNKYRKDRQITMIKCDDMIKVKIIKRENMEPNI